MSKEVSEEPEHARPKDYTDPPPAPLFDFGELRLWSVWWVSNAWNGNEQQQEKDMKDQKNCVFLR